MNICVRCGCQTEETIITKGNVGPLCRACFNLYCTNIIAWQRFPKLDKTGLYGAISFKEGTRAGPFWWQIIQGRKIQTIREPRRDGRPHVIVGTTTKLYYKVRAKRVEVPLSGSEKAMNLPHLIAYAEVTGYEEISLLDVWFDEENAIADGFEDLDEFRLWFYPDWFDFPEIFKDAIKRAAEAKLDKEVILHLGRAAGKSTLKTAVDYLVRPLKRIKFKVFSSSKATCPHCGKAGVDLTPVSSDDALCLNCNYAFPVDKYVWKPPHLESKIINI
ncbi:hypothetical protein KKH23_09790 [Patescibacteria group bacterium]|nr:hypothetical protein [Patescibacteria group bacterium]